MANPSERDAALLHNQDGAGPNHIGQLDNAGQAILKLLDQAAGAAEANSRRALETAQTLSSKLHAAQDRVAYLETELRDHHEKAERAEAWLLKISAEIEDRLIKEPEEKRRQMSRLP
jgi:hypothetical protein